MNATNQTDRRSTALLGILLALGLIIGGWVLGAQIKATRLSDRYVTVKGLVERTVKSDLAIWSLSYKEAGDDLSLQIVGPFASELGGDNLVENRGRHAQRGSYLAFLQVVRYSTTSIRSSTTSSRNHCSATRIRSTSRS